MANYGVAEQDSGTISTGTDGRVSVAGTAGNLTDPASLNYGVFVTDPNSLITSDGGDVSVAGIEGAGSSGIALVVENSGAISTAVNGGAITAIGDSMRFDDTAAISAAGSRSFMPPSSISTPDASWQLFAKPSPLRCTRRFEGRQPFSAMTERRPTVETRRRRR